MPRLVEASVAELGRFVQSVSASHEPNASVLVDIGGGVEVEIRKSPAGRGAAVRETRVAVAEFEDAVEAHPA